MRMQGVTVAPPLPAPDPEVGAKMIRRRLAVAYELLIVQRVDARETTAAVGELPRRGAPTARARRRAGKAARDGSLRGAGEEVWNRRPRAGRARGEGRGSWRGTTRGSARRAPSPMSGEKLRGCPP